MEHILKNTSTTLEITFSAGDADGAVTVTITRADGTALVTGAATTNEVAAGRYTYVLAPQTELDSLTVVWSGTWGSPQSITTFAEIVGGQLFSLAELRAFGDKQLASTTTYPDADLRAARARITDLFEDVCQVSFIPRYRRDVLDGKWNGTALWLTRKRVARLISVTIDGVALSAPDLALVKVYPTGRMERQAGWLTAAPYWQDVVVAYEHGWLSPPADISRAAMTLARIELASTDVTDRALSIQNEFGNIRLATPGRNFPTGVPSVDATLARYDETDPIPPG